MTRIRGRPLLLEGRTLYFSRKNNIFVLRDGVIMPFAQVESGNPLLALAPRLIDRLLRNEISLLRRMPDRGLLAVHRRGFHLLEPGANRFSPRWTIDRGSRPLGMSTENDGWMVYGEYGSLSRSEPVHVYAARYPSFAFEPVHSFAPGEVKHVHNVQWDPHDLCYWVLVGDADGESGILRLRPDFSGAEWLIRGSQLARAVNVFVLPDALLYATDSERARNWVVSVDKKSGAATRIQEIASSSLGAARMLGRYYVSTAVEPSLVNATRTCRLYESVDGLGWKPVARHAKDSWHPTYFQFGTLVMPHCVDAELLVYGGQAVRGLDGHFVVSTPEPGSPAAPSPSLS
jgi:hypothetical protein